MKQLLNGDAPDESQKDFLLKKFPNLVFLEDDLERFYFNVWRNSRRVGFSTVEIDPMVVFKYATKYDMDEIDTLEIVNYINTEAENGKKS